MTRHNIIVSYRDKLLILYVLYQNHGRVSSVPLSVVVSAVLAGRSRATSKLL